MEGSIARGDLAPKLGVAPPRPAMTSRSADSNATTTSGNNERTPTENPKKKRRISGATKLVPWAKRADRSCDAECTKFHGGRYCVFPGMKDGKPYAIPFILQSDDLLIALDPLGRVIQLKSKGGKPRIQEAVEKLGCDTSVFATLAAHNTVWYRMLFSMEHHGPDDVPERWKCVREGTSPSLHIQPGLPPDTNDMDLTWKSTLRAAKKLFDSLHTSTATAAGAVEGMLALASSPPLSDSGGVPSISEAGQGTPAAGGVDEPHSHLPMLDMTRLSGLRRAIEGRVASATDRFKAEHQLDMERIQTSLDTEQELTSNLRKQLHASHKESTARQEVAARLEERVVALSEENIVLIGKHDVLIGELRRVREQLAESFTQNDLNRVREEGFEMCLRSLDEVV